MAETEKTPEQENPETPGKEKEIEETYTKAQLTEMMQKEIGKVTAKHSKRYDDLKAELEAEKRKSLPDPEKVKAEIADKDKLIAEKDAARNALAIENAKLKALMKAGADPEKLDGLLKRVIGSTPEEIEADVAELKELGLIRPKGKGLGGGSQNGDLDKEPTLDEQIATLQGQLRDPKITGREKTEISKQIINISNRKILKT